MLTTVDAGIVSELLCATVARRRNEYISAFGALCVSDVTEMLLDQSAIHRAPYSIRVF